MLENINALQWRQYYKIVVFVVKPTRQFLLFRKYYSKQSLYRLHNYLLDNNRKPIYYVITFKNGNSYNIKANTL